jgi:hypothetical protein
MQRPKLIALVVLCAMLTFGFLTAARRATEVAAQGQLVRAQRQNKTDLEVTRIALPRGVSHGYISYKDLLALPQVAGTMGNDDNPTEVRSPSVPVTGVKLSVLIKRLGVPEGQDLLLARCSDGYVGPFPAEYIAVHEPILVLRANGMTLDEWAKKTGNEDPSPYIIAYDHFVPAWKVLAHSDREQLPDQIVELEFKKMTDVFDPITPPARFGPGSPVQIGFTIAKQNCLRCHAAGPYGGTKGGLAWEALTNLAKRDGAMFKKYAHDPKSVDPKSKMPGNPEYNASTQAAVTAYFQSLAKG